MATLVKIRGLSRGKGVSAAGVADATLLGSRGLRVPSAIGTVYLVGGTKASVNVGTGGVVTFTAKYAGTWANGTATAGLGIALVAGAGSGNLGPGTVTITGTSPSKHHALSFAIDSGVSTAANVVAAMNADPVLSQYGVASVQTGGAVTAQAEQQLASGANGTDAGQSLIVTASNRSTALVDVDDPKVARILRRSDYGWVSLGAA